MLTILNAFPKLFRRFDFAIVNPGRPWQAKGGRIWVITDFLVTVTARNQHAGM